MIKAISYMSTIALLTIIIYDGHLIWASILLGCKCIVYVANVCNEPEPTPPIGKIK